MAPRAMTPAIGEWKRCALAAPVNVGASGVSLGFSGDVPVGVEVVVSAGGTEVVQVLVVVMTGGVDVSSGGVVVSSGVVGVSSGGVGVSVSGGGG
ncbi:hypothetical protein BDV18DRAFT_132936 [Aspergillus unguis]